MGLPAGIGGTFARVSHFPSLARRGNTIHGTPGGIVGRVPLPEKALIAEIRKIMGASVRRRTGGSGGILTGIGDDCAVLRPPPGRDLLVTTDFSLEGIHFRRDWHPPESVGHRCVARGLSDLAAMGGEPLAVFLSLALPRDVPQPWVRRFMRGLIDLAERHGARLAGGDTAESADGAIADIVVVGSVPKGQSILRSGAKAGDRIYVSGELGGSAAAVLEMRSSKGSKKVSARDYPRHFYPEPRVELGKILRQKKLASAMIDTSDGLSTDLAHICEESGVGAQIAEELIPRARVGRPGREVGLDLALHGGEDYELLFTAPKGQKIPRHLAGVALTEIGKITQARRIFIRNPDGQRKPLYPKGWEHFSE